jgi:hypothetical protein
MGDFNDFIHAQSSKATPVDADEVPLLDSASSFASARLTWANIKATLKAYFDTLYPTRQRVRAATTANITISTALNNADTLDGVTLATGDLVLVKNQSAPEQNGIYVVGVSPARSDQFDTYNEHPGTIVTVQEGTANADTAFLCTSNAGGTLNTTAIVFASFGQDTRTVTAKTADYTVLAGDSGTIFTNSGTAADVTFTLPASGGCTAGKTRFTFLNLDATVGVRNIVLVAGSDHLYFASSGSPFDITGGGTANDDRVPGTQMTVRYVGGGIWYAESIIGIWS